MKTYSYIAVGVSIISLVVAFLAFNNDSAGGTASTTGLQKVLASGTIRAGYVVYPPYINKDPKTGEISGIFYDLTNTLGQQLGLKIEWVEEAGYGTIFTSLDSGRYDVYAGGIWANSTRSKAGYLTDPAFYNAIFAYAKTNDHRFDNNLDAINSADVKITTIDGELASVIAKSDYPKAHEDSLPQSTPYDQIPLQVITGKADVAFLQPDVAALFLQANPGTLRQVSTKPLRLYGNGYAVKLGEEGLYHMLNIATQEAVNSGVIDRILEKYQSSETAYLLLAPSYAK